MGGRAWRRDRGAEKPRDRGAQGPRNMEIAFVEARSGEKSVSQEELNANKAIHAPRAWEPLSRSLMCLFLSP